MGRGEVQGKGDEGPDSKKLQGSVTAMIVAGSGGGDIKKETRSKGSTGKRSGPIRKKKNIVHQREKRGALKGVPTTSP